MNKIITIGFFAVVEVGWGRKFIPWSEVKRVMPTAMQKALMEFIMGKKIEKAGVPYNTMKEFINNYYNIK